MSDPYLDFYRRLADAMTLALRQWPTFTVAQTDEIVGILMPAIASSHPMQALNDMTEMHRRGVDVLARRLCIEAGEEPDVDVHGCPLDFQAVEVTDGTATLDVQITRPRWEMYRRAALRLIKTSG